MTWKSTKPRSRKRGGRKEMKTWNKLFEKIRKKTVSSSSRFCEEFWWLWENAFVSKYFNFVFSMLPEWNVQKSSDQLLLNFRRFHQFSFCGRSNLRHILSVLRSERNICTMETAVDFAAARLNCKFIMKPILSSKVDVNFVNFSCARWAVHSMDFNIYRGCDDFTLFVVHSLQGPVNDGGEATFQLNKHAEMVQPVPIIRVHRVRRTNL